MLPRLLAIAALAVACNHGPKRPPEPEPAPRVPLSLVTREARGAVQCIDIDAEPARAAELRSGMKQGKHDHFVEAPCSALKLQELGSCHFQGGEITTHVYVPDQIAGVALGCQELGGTYDGPGG